MNCLISWPEPVIRVQHLSESGIRTIPERYVKRLADRPGCSDSKAVTDHHANNIPVIDMQSLFSDDSAIRQTAADLVGDACREWGFFQVVNHGVSHELLSETREAWFRFFRLPLEEKNKYANSPSTYEGYGSRLGVEKGMSLDWSDYFFLHYLPVEVRDPNKWPVLPDSCR